MTMKSSALRATEYGPALTPLDARSKELRRTVVRMLAMAKRGHVASAFSLIEIVRVLYDDILNIDPKNPRAENRDRCILSKGHGCLGLYAVLGDKGFFPEAELWKFCKPDGILGGHPEQGKVPGVEASTGSLGHGMPIGVGMALRAKMDKMNHRVFVVMGDGECNEGSVWEAALCAGKHKLDNFTILVDYNKFQSAGSTYEIQDLEPFLKKWESFNFAAVDVDGHDLKKLREVLSKKPYAKGKPTAIICHTVKGKGVSFVENNLDWHHKTTVTDEEFNALMKELSDVP